MTRGRTVAAAIVGSAEMRAAFKHLARNPAPRITGIVARGLRPAARIFRTAARPRRIGLMLRRIPITGSFPDTADHVMEAVAVRRKCGYRRGTFESVGRNILVREIGLPGVCHVLATRRQFVSPGEFRIVQSTACGEFPL